MRTAPPSPGRGSRVSPSGRVWALCGVLFAADLVVLILNRPYEAPLKTDGPVVWLLVAAAYGAAEVWVVHLQFRKEAHTVSLNEIPLVIGLYLLPPWGIVLAMVVGVVPALLLHRRQRSLKVIFNLLQFALSVEVAALVFHVLLIGGDPLGPWTWLAALMAALAAAGVGAVCVSAVISVSEGTLALRPLGSAMAFAMAGAAVTTGLALVGVILTVRDPRAGVLLLLPATALYGAYLAYNRERQKTERIEFLYNSGRMLSANSERAAGTPDLLKGALEMFRAEVAEVTTSDGRITVNADGTRVIEAETGSRPGEAALEALVVGTRGAVLNQRTDSIDGRAFLEARGLRDAIVTSLRADNRVIGTMVVGNWLGDVGGFTDEHLNLLETLGAQVGAAVENSRLERVLLHQAYHDSLTNLPNRARLQQRVEAALGRPENHIAVLLIDVDDFKVINDTMGHSVGDQLLVEVAERLGTAIRAADTAARIGGDEFALMLDAINSENDATATAHRVMDAFQAPFTLTGREMRVSASIGIATNFEGMLDPDTLMLQADVAMYAAKAASPGAFRVFESSMQDAVAERHSLREDLRHAVERGELVNYYQPLVSLGGGGLQGVEALVRWQHRERGLVPPLQFIQLAEESGLIIDVGRWVLREACGQLKRWQRDVPGAARMGVSVNLSAVQLRQPGFVDDVVTILKETDLDPSTLTLEITESTFMDDTRMAIARLRELRGLGIRLELDDFGTGYSSLSILRDLPLDGLKIDKSFVDVIQGVNDRPAFLQAIVRLAEALDLEMVGEGIEHEHQADALRAMGCTRGQGYLFARPMPALEAESYVTRTLEPNSVHNPTVVTLPARRRGDLSGARRG